MAYSEKPLFRAILTFILVLLIPSAVMSILILANSKATLYSEISAAASIFADIAVLYYAGSGFSKRQAWAYKTFVLLYLAVMLLTLVDLSIGEPDPIPTVASSVAFGLIIAAALGKDLGKRNSMVICGLIILACTVVIVNSAILHQGIWLWDKNENLLDDLRAITNLLLSAVFGLITTAKYLDKTERGKNG